MSATTDSQPIALPDRIALPDIPALFVGGGKASIMTTDGELKVMSLEQAKMTLHQQAVMLCHAPYTRKRLGLNEVFAFDVLELFAFTHPTKFTVPTPHGLCKALGLSLPSDFEETPMALADIATALLKDLQTDTLGEKADALKIAEVMGMQNKGWAWTPFIYAALGHTYEPVAAPPNSRAALNIWKHLPEWAEEAPSPPADHQSITGEESRERLGTLLSRGEHKAEARQQQVDYTTKLTAAFAPIDELEKPNIVLAEAGTGVGKTLGYLAPASVWAEKNQGTVWLSTYTKNLQRQIDTELDRLYPDPAIKDAHIAIRKGRENYLCLLNLEETAAGAALARTPNHAIAVGIMARWSASSKDGDLTGADFPGWLAGLLGYQRTLGLADRRGECIYSACDHYHKCFVERSIRKAKRARLVVANHALAMIGAALSTPGDDMPSRYVFDEGHHLFNAADSAFAAHLSGRETQDLRRWILGAEGGRTSRGSAARARGLKRRLEDLVEGDAKGEELLKDILYGAQALSTYGWEKRLKEDAPSGPCEIFLQTVYAQVFTRGYGSDGPYSMETTVHPIQDDVPIAAKKLQNAINNIQKPMEKLRDLLLKKLEEDEGLLEADTRRRMDALAHTLDQRARMTLGAWASMLEDLQKAPYLPLPKDNVVNIPITNKFVDWFEIDRHQGRIMDVGYYRHHIDPMKPFAAVMRPHLHGMVVTSATLKDREDDWKSAMATTGAPYLSDTPMTESYSSPFNYAERTKVIIINDVNKNSLTQVAGAYRTLFKASGGGALGLFTAISRLRAVHEHILEPLEQSNITLYGQHVDDMDAGTLVDIFRDDINSCLLGTDAIRDGVDVPGDSLRLIVFDRVPWPRPTILHKARREGFAETLGGKRAYDEFQTRMKLKQAYGRLIRRADDRGVFVMLDSMFPSRLHNAFPPEVEVIKCGLAEATQTITQLLTPKP